MRRSLAVLLVLVAGSLWAETKFNSVSVTATSTTVTFQTRRAHVMICNAGANVAYFRIFNEGDTAAAATTSSSKLVAGTATAPVCISYQKAATEPAYYKYVSLVCDTAETATVTIYSQ